MFHESKAFYQRSCMSRLNAYFRVLPALILTFIAIGPRAQAQTACNVVYTISPQNSSAFGAAITIQNTGTTALSSWTLTWTYANGQTVSSLWNGIETQTGANVTVKNEPYNGSIPAGGSLSGIGFNGTWNGSTNAVPASFAINGTTCGAALGSFSLKPSATTLTIAQGSSATDTVTVTDVSPFAGSVAFTASAATGIGVTFSPTSSATSSIATVSVASSVAAGTYPVTITGTSSSLTATTSVSVTVPPASGFTLSPSASALSVALGGSGTDTITVKDTGSFTGSVSFAASGAPTGVTVGFNPTASATSTVATFTVASSTVAGTYPITITGTSGTLTATASVSLTVTGLGGFSLSASPTSLSIAQGASGTDTVTVTDVSPFAGSVSFAASGMPTGVTAAFSPASSTSSSVVTLSVASTVATGTYPITITGTSGTLSATTGISLTVTGGGGGACQVVYTISPQSTTAFGAALTIQNTSATALTSWTLTWSFANGQTVSSLWNGIETQSGANVTVKNEPYNGSIPAGGSATGIGFNGTWNGSANAVPTNFAINGTVCGGVSQGSFTLKPSAASLSVAAGASGTDTITVTDVSPFTGSVAFTASGMPTGVTASFSPTSSAASSVVTFAAAATTVAGTYPITITGTSGTLTATTSISLIVTSGGSFTLAPSATTLTVAPGSSGTDTITVSDISPFTGSVTLAASGMPTGVTAAFGTNPATASSVLTFTAASTTVAGTYPVTITGTSGTLTPATTSIALTITGGTPVNATVTVNQSSTGPAVSNQILGMNLAAWYDVVVNQTAIVDAFQTAGIKAVRWPGGSWSDIYHWSTNANCFGSTDGNPAANNTFTNFLNDIAIPAGLDLALTADYGTNAACTGGGDPSEAASWVSAALTNGVTVSHMTVGNEEYGSWEEDLHSSKNNPATYAAAVIGTSGYYSLIKAASPHTLVGVVVDADNSNGGWDNTVLTNAKGSYDFVEYHFYPETPGQENDTALVQQDAQELTTNINTIKAELTKWGTPNTPIYVGEIGGPYSNPGKQSWSISQGLYAGQVLGELMNDGVSRLTWWIGFGNCNGQAGNDSSSLYGWQSFGAYNVFSDGPSDPTGNCPNAGAIGTLSPTARAFQLFSNVAVDGESVLTTNVTGDTTDVVAYAATSSGGTALVLFNRNQTNNESVSITLSAQTAAKTVTVETYDKAIYDESNPATTNTWAAPTSSTISSPTLPLTLTLAPWSMNVVIIH